MPRQSYLDFGDPAEHFRLIHGRHAQHVAICAKDAHGWHERVHAHDMAAEAVALLAANHDVNAYQSQSGFRSSRRASTQASALPGVFVDLDHYKIPELAALDPDALLDRIMVALPWLPVPTMIIASGRGCYFSWLFKRPLDGDQLARWQAVEDVLVATLAPWGADPHARDAARVLRIVGSVNQTSGATVTGAVHTGGAVAFSTLEKVVMLHGRAPASSSSWPETPIPPLVRPSSSPASPAQRAQHLKPLQLAQDRMADFRRLAELRGVPLTDGRARLAFAFACSAVWFVSGEEALAAEITGFAAECFEDGERYGVRQVVTVLDRMRADRQGIARIWEGRRIPNRYRMRNSTLIALLEITPAEQAHMRCLIGPEERQNRRVARRRAAGMVDRHERADERRQAVFALWRGGLTQPAIASELGVNQSTVSRIVTAIRRAAERERTA